MGRETLVAAQKILLEEPDLICGLMSDSTESAVNVSMVTVRKDHHSTLELEEACKEDEEKVQDLTSDNCEANFEEEEVLDTAKDLKPRKDFPNDASTLVDPSKYN